MLTLCAGTGPLAAAPPYSLCSAFLLSPHCTSHLYNIEILHLLGHSMIAMVFGAIIKVTHSIIFVVAPCMLIVLSPLNKLNLYIAQSTRITRPNKICSHNTNNFK